MVHIGSQHLLMAWNSALQLPHQLTTSSNATFDSRIGPLRPTSVTPLDCQGHHHHSPPPCPGPCELFRKEAIDRKCQNDDRDSSLPLPVGTWLMVARSLTRVEEEKSNARSLRFQIAIRAFSIDMPGKGKEQVECWNMKISNISIKSHSARILLGGWGDDYIPFKN